MTQPTTIAVSTPVPARPLSTPAEPLAPTKAISLVKAHMELGKVRLSAMVVFTTALGFVVGAKQLLHPLPNYVFTLLCTCLGTFLAAVGASAFNQAIETRRDAAMHRTRNRPLPARVLTRTYAATFGLCASIAGVALICPTSNGLTASLAAANVLIYALLYTPLKPYSSTNTLVGAVVGGIPPMLGWTAATNSLDVGAWLLGAILFVWQIPHFLALAWMYRDDYARGGFMMLPRTDASGRLTALFSLVYSLFLLPICIALYRVELAGLTFVVLSLALTGLLIACSLRFMKTRDHASARRLFLCSIIYLPILTVVLMIDSHSPLHSLTQTEDGYISPPAAGETFKDPSGLLPDRPAR